MLTYFEWLKHISFGCYKQLQYYSKLIHNLKSFFLLPSSELSSLFHSTLKPLNNFLIDDIQAQY